MKSKGGSPAGGGGRFHYNRTASELDAANAKAHMPHKMPAQSEAGADALKAGHRKVQDHGMISRPTPLPGAQSSPLTGSVDCPYD